MFNRETAKTAANVQRFTKNIKAEMNAATAQLNLDGYEVSADNRIITDIEADFFYGIEFYHYNGEVIAVPSFYMMEGDGSTFTGSRGGEYVLYSETLYIEE
jgi:hypothetical protein